MKAIGTSRTPRGCTTFWGIVVALSRWLLYLPDIKGGKGDANSLFLSSEVPKPHAGKGEALVKIRAFGLNRMDLLQREGQYPVPPGVSQILGVEFSGTIVELGPGIAEKFKTGDEVFGLAYGGICQRL